MSASFAGKTVLVTGAGSGIGRAACEQFGAAGAQVVAADINADGAAETVALVTSAGGTALAVTADVSVEQQVVAMVAEAVATFGGLDAAVNNAAMASEPVPFTDITLERWQRIVDTNLTSVFLCMREELRHMSTHGGGAIVNVSSGAAFVPTRGLGHYTATKSGVLGLTKSGAVEYARQNIRVNTVVPGSIDTPMLRHAMGDEPDVVAEISKRWVMGRPGQADEVAAAAVWLCSADASFVNGTPLIVDGGNILR